MLDITTLAAWGEFIGGIAVVVSLLYLALQIRQNSRLLKVSTTGAVATSDLEISKLLISDSELHRIYDEGLADRDALSETERRRFDVLVNMQMRLLKRKKASSLKPVQRMPPPKSKTCRSCLPRRSPSLRGSIHGTSFAGKSYSCLLHHMLTANYLFCLQWRKQILPIPARGK